MRRTYLLILLLGICTMMMQAQESSSERKPLKENKLIQLDFDMGINHDLAHRSEGNMLSMLSDKQSVFPAINFRIQHFFARKWGWYTNVSLGIPQKYERDVYADLAHRFESEYYVKNTLGDGQTEPGTIARLDGGVVYRMENTRWAFYPRFGFGLGFDEYQEVGVEWKKKGGNELYRMECYGEGDRYDNAMTMFVLSMGFSANYKFSRYCYLLLNVNYTQPLGRQTCIETVSSLYDSEIIERKVHKSSTIGRNMNVSIGLGFPIYLGKNKKEKTPRRERMRRIMEQKRNAYGLFRSR